MNPLSQFAAEWPAISALLDEALMLPASAHADWLASLNGARAHHRDALRTLLSHRRDVETDDFLREVPKLDLAAEPGSPGLASGGQIGPYRLIAEVGRGGMGTVWLAERSDGIITRRVALKLPGVVWGDTFAERFVRERQILATLEHQHIARLYDAGVDAHGRPFLAMEYVQGQTIDAYARAHELPLRERIALLLQVMSAVAHAHARLVVHRDLKPGNILVSDDGQVKLLDFGIAKLLEGERTQRTALTELGGRALTPEYASPEQIRGEPLGTASDVYSLGVVAFELLTGARPYRLKRGSAAEIEEAIAHAEPMRLSEAAVDAPLARQLRGDLDAIVQKALKKPVEERYRSVDNFAQDLERYLRGEPVQAQPDSRRYRAGKFVRRHRFAIAMSAALGVSVIAGAGFSLWQASLARQQAARAEAEVDAQLAVRDLYRETLMALSATSAKEPAALAKPHAIVGALRSTLDDVKQRYAKRPTARAAQLDAVAAQLNYDSDVEGSLAVGRELLDSLKQNHAAPDRVIRAYSLVARALFLLKRFDESEQMRRESVNWQRDVVDPVTVSARSFAYKDLGSLLISQGRRAEAEQVLLEGDALMDRTFPDGEFTFVPLELSSLYLGFDDAKALQFARKGHQAALARPEADADQHAFDWLTFGSALAANGLAADAEAALRESLRLLMTLYEPGAGGSMRVFNRLVGSVSRQSDYARATTLLTQQRAALAALRRELKRSEELYLQGRAAEIAWLAGDVAKAANFAPPLADTAFVGMVRSDNDSPALCGLQLRLLAGRAAETLEMAQGLRQAWPKPGQPTVAWVQLEQLIASAQLGVGDAAGARATVKALRALLAEQHASGSGAYRTTLELEALAATRQGERDAATQMLVTAAAVTPPAPYRSAVERADSLLRRAAVFSALGRTADAAEAGRAALADLGTQTPDSPRLIDARRYAVQQAPSS